MEFSWDEIKDRENQRKHGISFAEAVALFTSDDYLEIFDTDHSEDEDRFIAIGLISRGLIVVVWTPIDEAAGRLISARPATRREERLFAAYMGTSHD